MKAILKKLFNAKAKVPLPVGLPNDHKLYCVGDIHGRVDLLQQVHGKIALDAATFEGVKTLVYLGDYIDRGMHSRQVIDSLLENNFPDFGRVFLLGNHEQVLMQFLWGNDDAIAHEWFRFGGLSTLVSYGVKVRGIPTTKDLAGLRAELLEKLPAAHVDFLERLVLKYELGGYFFVHAGIRPKVKLPLQHPEDMLWIREEFLTSDVGHGKVIVHGHTVTDEPELRHNRIGLDTGAYITGRLTCAVFEGSRCQFL